jgi:hypothetical protein
MDQEKILPDGQTGPSEQKYVSNPKLTPSFKILEEAVTVWWKNLKQFVMMYVWAFVAAIIPIVVVVAIFALNFIPSLTANLSFKIFSALAVFVSFLFIFYYSVRSYIAMFLLVKNNYVGSEKEIYQSSKKLFWPYIGLTLLTTLFILLWTCLLIIPGIIFSILYSFAVYVLFFEDKKGMAAIKRSVQLVKHYWWAVFGRFCLFGLVIWLFMLIISVPIGLTPENTLMFSIWNAIVQVINMLIGPIALLFSYRIYQDLVKIKK